MTKTTLSTPMYDFDFNIMEGVLFSPTWGFVWRGYGVQFSVAHDLVWYIEAKQGSRHNVVIGACYEDIQRTRIYSLFVGPFVLKFGTKRWKGSSYFIKQLRVKIQRLFVSWAH